MQSTWQHGGRTKKPSAIFPIFWPFLPQVIPKGEKLLGQTESIRIFLGAFFSHCKIYCLKTVLDYSQFVRTHHNSFKNSNGFPSTQKLEIFGLTSFNQKPSQTFLVFFQGPHNLISCMAPCAVLMHKLSFFIHLSIWQKFSLMFFFYFFHTSHLMSANQNNSSKMQSYTH